MKSNAQRRQERDSSLELGDPTLRQQYNKQGRPVRRGAGKKKNLQGYVDSAIIEAEDDDPIEVPSEDDDGEIIKPVRARKRKRSPSPAPPPDEPILHNEEPDELSDGEPKNLYRRNASNTPIVLQFNVPLGYHGPLIVKLDKSVLTQPKEEGHNVYPPRGRKCRAPTPPSEGTVVVNKPRDLFHALPVELRIRIYEELFVADSELRFHSPVNFCRSAQLLRVRKSIHDEAAPILYGKNKFVFDRNRHQRAPFWDPQPKEIGYKDVRQFLKMIGPANLAHLRDVKLTLEDASPAATPYLPSHESRRYLNDEHLIDCLRILRETRLRKIQINFHGRRMLLKSDGKFLSYLEQIKADEVSSTEMCRWYGQNKISDEVFKELKEVMTRKKKLYAEKK